jgi:lycopene cyclase domain-containing protein
VSHLAYLAVLAGCLLAAGWLEFALHTRVFQRWRRLLLTLVPVLAFFCAWDWYAISRGQWSFDPRHVTGWLLPGRLPVEEVLFFAVVPVCSVLCFEAVRIVRARKP